NAPSLKPTCRLLAFLPVSEIFPDTDHGIASPWPVYAQVGGSEVAISYAVLRLKKKLGHADFESVSDFDARTPRPLPSDPGHRPRIQRLRHILPEQETWFAKKHEPSQRGSGKWTQLHISPQHVAHKGITRSIDTAEIAGIGGA